MAELDTNVDAHIYTSASETGYEPIDHDIHTIDEAEEEEMLDNLAYGGKMEDENETTGHQRQCEAVVELKRNESYSSRPAQDQDEREYSYPTFSVVSPAQMD